MSRNDTAKCPNCGEIIETDPFDEVGDEIVCHYCDTELVITGKNPLRVKIVKRSDTYDEYEDGGDYYDNDL